MKKYILILVCFLTFTGSRAQTNLCATTRIKGKMISKTLTSVADVKKAYLAEFEIIKAYDSLNNSQTIQDRTVVVIIRSKKYSPTLLEKNRVYTFSVSPETLWDKLNYKRFGKRKLARKNKLQCSLWAWGETFIEEGSPN